MTDGVGNQLVDFINAELSMIDDPIDFETDLLVTGALDSLAVVQITVWMEDNLGIEVDPLDVVLDNFQTVRQMCDYVARSKSD